MGKALIFILSILAAPVITIGLTAQFGYGPIYFVGCGAIGVLCGVVGSYLADRTDRYNGH